ncbi:Dyp-type peroxidase [Streptomyces sp. NBC_00879]|uniref:Dyp-type peroxidase n=1 Tax=Streptomyces sp. NBC_00879 TaxID=2975855 RepID=UPI0038673197|nr:Dyp-type peroxidase [Streptomyces sp. NBC_00879]
MPLDLANKSPIGPKDAFSDLPSDLDMYLRDIQGNILKSHGRDHSQHLFIQFTEPAEARKWLGSMAGRVTSASKQWKDSLQRRKIFAEAEKQSYPAAWREAQLTERASDIFINVLISKKGYDKLGTPAGQIPQDAAFLRGAQNKETTTKLGDPPVSAPAGHDQWEAGFQQDLHALVIVADDSAAKVALEADRISDEVGRSGGRIAHREIGTVLRYGENGPVREHFGFVDGVSNPLFYAADVEKAKPVDGQFRFDPSAPLGLVLVKDPGGDKETGYGTYFVYRKLEQNIAQFNHDRFVLATAIAQADGREAANEADKDLAGAYIMGRFRDGAPVVEFASESGVGKDIPNNFDYKQDPNGDKCPFQAHTRKTNPRGDTGSPLERDARIVRRAISFDVAGKVGLLFLCAQSSIPNQFEFMQKSWCNDPKFLRPEVRPNPPGALDTGLDPIIGQGEVTEQEWPQKHGNNERIKATLKQSVTMMGGEYFFMPSLSFLEKAGA